jgi:hypothetical protein
MFGEFSLSNAWLLLLLACAAAAAAAVLLVPALDLLAGLGDVLREPFRFVAGELNERARRRRISAEIEAELGDGDPWGSTPRRRVIAAAKQAKVIAVGCVAPSRPATTGTGSSPRPSARRT